MRAISAIDDRRERGDRRARRAASTVDGVAERVGHAVEHEHRREALDEPLDEQGQADLRPTSARSERGTWRARRRRARAPRPAPTPRRASTTMNANEIGSAARERRLQLDQLSGGDGAADDRERRPGAARMGDLDPDSDRRAPEHEDSTRAQRLTTLPPAPRERARRPRSDRGRPNRSRLPAERLPTRARRPRGRRRSARRGVSMAAMSASTHSALNCVPAPSRSSANAVSWLSARRYERVEVMASKASATWMIAGSIRPLPSTAALAASVVVSPATGARKSMRCSSSTDTTSWRFTRSNSASVRRPGLLSSWFGTMSLPMSCMSAA